MLRNSRGLNDIVVKKAMFLACQCVKINHDSNNSHLEGIILKLTFIFSHWHDKKMTFWYFVTKIVLTYCEKKLFL